MGSQTLGRRRFLALGAGAATAPWWRLARSGRADAGPVEELKKQLVGHVVGRADPGYDAARVAFDTIYDGVKPIAVAYCAGPGDVSKTIAWARKHAVRLAPRCGGHSYAGYSTTPGVIVDVSRLNTIAVDKTAGTATIGAGARLIDVYTKLGAAGLAIPAGSCASVGVSGLTLGGGHGFLSRKWGLATDNVLEFEVVTADGRRLVCNSRLHSDLFWACRGGGLGNFGVVTRWKFRVHPISTVTTFIVSWSFDQLPTALAAWQSFAPHGPDELFSVLSMGSSGGTVTLSAVGQFLGTRAETLSLIQPLASAGTPSRVGAIERPFLDAVRMWAGCTALDTCHLGAGGELQRATFAAKSDYARQPLPAAAAAVISAALYKVPTRGLLLLDSYGGAINRVPKAATAFVHRDMLFSFQYLTYWTTPDLAGPNRKWLADFHTAMRPYVSGEAYQNYVDRDLTTWRQAYYGSNLPRLVSVKKRYDPQNVFRYAQSIPLSI